MIDESDKKQLLLDYNNLVDAMSPETYVEMDRFLHYASIDIRAFCEKYGVDNTIQYLKQMKSIVSPYEWRFFAIAGIAEVEPELRSYLHSEHTDDVVEAAIGLAYLGQQDGFDTIINLIKIETSKPPKDIQKLLIFTPVGPPRKAWELDEFKDHLTRMTDPRATAILRDYAFFFKKSF